MHGYKLRARNWNALIGVVGRHYFLFDSETERSLAAFG